MPLITTSLDVKCVHGTSEIINNQVKIKKKNFLNIINLTKTLSIMMSRSHILHSKFIIVFYFFYCIFTCYHYCRVFFAIRNILLRDLMLTDKQASRNSL